VWHFRGKKRLEKGKKIRGQKRGSKKGRRGKKRSCARIIYARTQTERKEGGGREKP